MGKTNYRLAGALLIALGMGAAAAAGPVETRHSLTLEGARSVAAAAAAEARKAGAGAAIAIVDAGGSLIYLERLDGTFAAAAAISIEKARTAAQFRLPTSRFEDAVRDGRVAFVANREALPLRGGVPIVVDGEVVGAIGVSGAKSGQHDEEIAVAAAATVE